MNCVACDFKSENLSELNKHLYNCEYYDDWFKNYVPPKEYTCKECQVKFTNPEYLEEHNKNCKK
jgi:hypothetical protein